MESVLKFLRKEAGFSLVELMIAMLLGLFLIGGVVSVFLSNKQIYRQNENLARMQENARYAFEVVGRDVREAAGIVCGATLNPTNALTNPSNNWWSSWNDGSNDYNGLRGFYGKQDNALFPQAFPTDNNNPTTASRVEGADDVTTPDALMVLSATGQSFTITAHDPTGVNKFTLNTSSHGFSTGDILMACDYGKAALFLITGITGAQIEHSASILQTSIFQPGGQLAKLSANAWYIGYNGRGGRSLYRVPLGGNPEEIAEGVIFLQIEYLVKDGNNNLPTSYVRNTSGISDWNNVVAVRIQFTLQSLENVGTNTAPLTRTWNTVITLRNRNL